MTRALFLVLIATLMLTPGAQAVELGRLFYTPEQRAAITQARLRGTSIDEAPIAMPSATAGTTIATPLAPAPPRSITLTGLLDRPRGGTAWLDGEAVDDGGTVRGFRVEVRRGVVRLHRDDIAPITLRVGESLDLTSFEVSGPDEVRFVRRGRR